VSALAVLPLVTILALMLGLRWSAARAGVAGLLVTIVVAAVVFDFPAGLTVGAVPAGLGVAAESGFVAGTILWIIGPALGIHHLQVRTGATETLRQGLGRLTPDPRMLALLIAWFFALFMEGAAGFGTSVALAAPFLVGVGFRPLTAIVAAMLGHAVGVSFGAVGTPIVPQVAATGLSALELSRATGLYHGLLGWIPLVAAMVVVVRATPDVRDRTAATWLWTAGAAVAFLLPATTLAWFVGPELPTLGGALFGAVLFVAALVLVGRRDRIAALDAPLATEPGAPAGALLRAASPYLALVTLVLVTRLITPLQEVLRSVELSWQLPGGFAGSVAPLYHPGTLLLAGFLIAAAVQRVPRGEVRVAVGAATRSLAAVAVALVAMLGLSRLMVHAAMIDELAVAAAALAGSSWPLFAPLVGALGTFVTGSATASNILFTDFQVATAETLELPVAPLVGVQGFGAAMGNAICPHNIVAASATVGLTGQEGEVLRRTLGVTVVYALLGGAVALVLVT
jgi:lactate permease